jgi:hypothetical protein
MTSVMSDELEKLITHHSSLFFGGTDWADEK